LILLIFVAAVVLAAFSYPPRARLVPLVIGLPTLAMLIYALIGEQFLPRLISRFEVSIADFTPGGTNGIPEEKIRKPVDGKAIGLAEEKAAPAGAEWKRTASILGWMVAFIAAIIFLGYLVSIPLFSLVFLKFQARASWLVAFLFTGTLFAFIYALFGMFFPAGLFQGVVFGAFLPPL
jgi:hypothetical protein